MTCSLLAQMVSGSTQRNVRRPRSLSLATLTCIPDIPLSDLQNIFSRLSRQPSFVTQEYIGGGQDYAALGEVTVPESYGALRDAFGGNGLAGLNGWENNSKSAFQRLENEV